MAQNATELKLLGSEIRRARLGSGLTQPAARGTVSLRDRRPLSQADVARALGVSRKSVSAYESGEREPPARVLLRLADVLDGSLDLNRLARLLARRAARAA